MAMHGGIPQSGISAVLGSFRGGWREILEIFALTDHLEYYRELKEKGEKITMCKAFTDHYKSGVEEGKKQGMKQGMAYDKGSDDAYMRQQLGLSVGELVCGLGERFTASLSITRRRCPLRWGRSTKGCVYCVGSL